MEMEMKKKLFILSLFKPIYASTEQQTFTLTLSSLSHAASISYTFFGTLFYYVYRLCALVLSPFLYILGFLYRQLVIKPYELAAHVAHLLYPVTMFCLAAIFCGAVIGGFAGFAAEACSSLIISATWGPDAEKKSNKQQQKKQQRIKEVIDETEADAQMDDYDDEEEEYDLFQNDQWEVPHTSKGKEPMRPRMESWRDSFSSASSRSSPGLIRRMKMSSTPTSNNDRKNSWEWEDDDFGGPTITKRPLI